MRRYGACLLPVEAWRSLVARLLREQEVVGSSPVASTNVETRLFCKESAFLRTLFAFCRFLLLPESSLSGFLFFTSPFCLFGFFVA